MEDTRVPKQVLLVDDDQSLLPLISRWLTDAGYVVVACDTFEAAKYQLAIAPPDVLLTDLRLGAFNGLQLVILVSEQHPDTVSIVMSAYDDPTLRKEAARCAAHYLPKPFSGETLLNLLNKQARSKSQIETL